MNVIACGLDFGNTNSCLSVCSSEGRIINFENDHGEFLTHNSVSISDGECFVGSSTQYVDESTPNIEFRKVGKLIGEKSQIPINLNGYDISDTIYPQHIVSIVLKYINNCLAARLLEPSSDVVIAIPREMQYDHRNILTDCAKIAGFNVLSILEDPLAAAITLIDCKPEIQNAKVMVFDYGASHLSVSIVDINGHMLQIISSETDYSLGGDYIDEAIFEHVRTKILENYQIDINEDPTLKAKALNKACEAKIALEYCPFYDIRLNDQIHRILYKAILDRMINELRPKIETLIRSALEKVHISPNEIDDIILSGGVSSMSIIKEMVARLMDKEPCTPVPTYSVVSYGAARYAESLIRGNQNYEIIETLNRGIGLAFRSMDGNRMHPFVQRNTRFPFVSSDLHLLGIRDAGHINLPVCVEDFTSPDGLSIIEQKIISTETYGDDPPRLVVNFVGNTDEITVEIQNGNIKHEIVLFKKQQNYFNESEMDRIKQEINEMMESHPQEGGN